MTRPLALLPLWLLLCVALPQSVGAQPALSPDASVGQPPADDAQPPPPEAPPPPAEAPPQPQPQPPATAPPRPGDTPPQPPPTDAPPPPPQADGEPPPITRYPELTQYVEARYPPRARAESLEAEVMLQIDLDTAGHVEAVEVVTPATPAGYGFDEAAVAAARQFVFTPAMAGQQPVPVRITYRYRFFLQQAPAQLTETPAAGQAQPTTEAPEPVVNFEGALIERGTLVPLPGLVVTLFRGDPKAPQQAFEAVTDADGRFEFFDLATGDWNLLVEAEGYFPVRSTETVVEGQRTTVRYHVERGSYNPLDVLVEVDRPRREVSRTSLSIAQIERIPGTAGDALAVVQNLPGVARPAPLSGEIIVRGAAPEDTRVVLEGMEIPIIYHFGGLRSVVPTPMLDGIDFYPGNFGPEFGRATGGIVDVRIKRLKPERIGGVADVSLLDTNLFLEAPIGDDAALAVAVRRSYVDVLLSAVADASDDINLVTAPRYYDAQLLAQYRPAPGHELRLFSLLSDDELKVLFADPGEADITLTSGRLLFAIDFHRTIGEYRFTPSERFENVLRVAGGQDRTLVEFAQFEYDLGTTSFQVRNTSTVGLHDDLDLIAGVDHLTQTYDGRVYLPAPPREGDMGEFLLDDAIASEVAGESAHAFGAFLRLQWLVASRLTLLPGVRFDHFTRAGENELSPRMTARLKIDPQWTAKAAAGLFYQEPTPDETDEGFGNPDAGTEGAVHYAAGVEYKPLPHLLLDVTGFYKTLFDLIAPSDALVERDGERVPEQVANTGEGRVYGAEILLRHELHENFMGWIGYTLMRSERRDRPGDRLRLFSRDQTHILTAVGTYRLPRNWEFSARWRLVSGNPSTPVTGGILDADRDEYSPVFGALYSDRIPPFHQLDLRVDKRWIWPNLVFGIYLDVQNIYNRANPEGVSYSYDYSEKEYAQGLPILPILGLRAEF